MLFATMAKDKSQSQQKQEPPSGEKPPFVETTPTESVKMSVEDELLCLREERDALMANLNRVGENWAEGCERISVLEKRNEDLRVEVETAFNRLMESADKEGRLEARIAVLEKSEAPAKKSVTDLSALPISEQLTLLEQGLKDALTTVSELHAEIDKRKAAAAELRELVEVLEPKSYGVPQQGNILPQKGQRVSKHRHPGLFAAIVSQGRVGIHFHFVTP